ncbi:protein phosphatase regulator [Coemansia nantahalensis]|nr:protein phosphatase regulator [Coemansia nantahalensis]
MGDSARERELIRQWLEVNPGDEEQARFYLTANRWNLNEALSNFYNSPPLSEGLPPSYSGDAVLPPDPLEAAAAPGLLNPPTAAPAAFGGPVRPSAPMADAAAAPVPRQRHGSGARIATLSSLGGNGSANEAGDAPPEWYTGGERSGMAVQAPDQPGSGGGGDEGQSLVDRILRRATEGGPAPGASDGARQAVFAGRGRTTNSTAANESSDSEDDSRADGSGGEVAVRELTFWRNGFSIGDGPLYSLEDPANRQNLDAILQGRAPLDILNVRPGQHVEMKIAVRRGEDYAPPPPPPAQPFAGRGQRLGGISTPIASAPAPAPAPAAAPEPIVLDPAQPTVQVQIRLADGSRLVARVNPSHTVAALRAHILAQRPGAAARGFALRSVMPPKVLDDATTIADAGIANATVAQQLI